MNRVLFWAQVLVEVAYLMTWRDWIALAVPVMTAGLYVGMVCCVWTQGWGCCDRIEKLDDP